MQASRDNRRVPEQPDRLTGTWYCHSGKHEVSNAIESITYRGRRTCANCAVRIRQSRKKDMP